MQTLNDNNLNDYYRRLDYAEIKAAIGAWAKDYPCIEKIRLYRMKRDKDFPKDPKYVFVVVAPGVPAKSDRNNETAQNIIRYFEEIHENCSHINHLMEDFYRIDMLPNREIPPGYQDEWFWFTIAPEERIEDYEMVMDIKPLVIYERNGRSFFAASAVAESHATPRSASSAEERTLRNSNDSSSNKIEREDLILTGKDDHQFNFASALGKMGASKRWEPIKQLMEQAIDLAATKWANGDQAWHSEMARYLLGKAEFKDLNSCPKALQKKLIPIADKYGRVRGKREATKEKK